MRWPMLVPAGVLAFAQLAVAQTPDSTRYVDVVTNADATCVMRGDGAAFCTGAYDRPLAVGDAPPGRCGIISCDLKFVRIKFTAPVERLTSVGCGLAKGGAILCISVHDDGMALPYLPPGTQSHPAASFTGSFVTACILDPDGVAYCRGSSDEGQLGTGESPSKEGSCFRPCKANFTRVAGSQKWTSIAAAPRFTCALASDKKAYCWGIKSDGRLGDGTNKAHDVPKPVAGDQKFSAIAVGDDHACALAEDGKAYCWGRGKEGQLGRDSLTAAAVPSAVSGGLTFTSLHAAAAQTCGLTAAGKAYCWGKGEDGQLGTGEKVKAAAAPAAVAGDIAFSRLSLGDAHTCGVSREGKAYCWGKGSRGQLGTGAKDPSLTPLLVALP